MAIFYYSHQKPELGPMILDRPILIGVDEDGEFCFDYMSRQQWEALEEHLEKHRNDPEVKYKANGYGKK